MQFEVPNTDTVYIQGIASCTNEDRMAEFFGSIGKIKMDRKTKKPKVQGLAVGNMQHLHAQPCQTMHSRTLAGVAVP